MTINTLFRLAFTAISIITLCHTFSMAAAEQLVITTTEGGQIKDKILSSDFEDMTSLTIQGPVNAQDIQYLTSNSGIMASVQTLDLYDAELVLDGEIYHIEVEGGSGMGTSYRYEYRLSAEEYCSSHWDGLSTTTTQICGNNLAAAFIKTEFEKIVLPKSNPSIGDRAFENCAKLKEVILGGQEKYIGERAFFRCTALETINMTETIDSIGSDAFHETKSLKYIDISRVSKFAAYSEFRYGKSFPYNSPDHGIFRKSGLTEITLSDKCCIIPENCFFGCNDLKTINIPGSITKIPDQAFFSLKSLSELNLGEGIEEIGKNNFTSSQLTKVSLPSTLISIGDDVFSNSTKLTDVDIPKSLMSLGKEVFSNSPFLANTLQEENNVQYLGNIAYKVTSGITSELNIREGTTIICNYFSDLYLGYSAGKNTYAYDIIEQITLPSTLLHIGNYSFKRTKNLSSIVIPEGTISIGKGAFYGSTLKEVVLSSSLQRIGHQAFSNCEIKSLALPDNIEIIGYRAFGGTKITSITLPKNLKKISKGAFAGITTLVKINYNCIKAELDNEEVGYLEGESFNNLCYPFDNSSCDLLYIGEDVEILPDFIFSSMSSNISHITFPSSLKAIGTGAFSDLKSLISMDIPDGLEHIGERAFAGTSLSSVDLPTSLRHIGKEAFYGTSLKEICFPSELTFIGHRAFGEINTLEKVIYNCTCARSDTFTDDYDHHKFEPPFANSICSEFVINDNVEYIMPSLLEYANISFLTLDLSNITNIGEKAFHTKHLDKVIFSEKTKHIPSSLFVYCDVTEVVLPSNLESIGDSVFYWCNRLSNIEFPKALKHIGNHAFRNCALSEIVLPDSLLSLGSYAFFNNRNAFSYRRLSLPPSLETIGEYAFSCCSGPNALYIPNNIKSIGKGAFTFGEYVDNRYFRVTPNLDIISMAFPIPESEDSPFYYCLNDYQKNCNDNWELIVPFDTRDSYINDDNWSRFNKINEFGALHCNPNEIFSPDLSQLCNWDYYELRNGLVIDGVYAIPGDFDILNTSQLRIYSSTEKKVADNLPGKRMETHDLAADFRGLYLLLPAGLGKIEIKIDPNFGAVELQQGNGQHITVKSSIENMEYNLTEPIPLFIYRLEDQEHEFSVIESIKIIPDGAAVETFEDVNNPTVIGRFMFDGRRVSHPAKGSLVIEYLSDGSTRKVISK